MNILLVEPQYTAKFFPLGLMRISSMHKAKGDTVMFTKGMGGIGSFKPDKIYITTLFTFEYPETIKTVRYYVKNYPGIDIWVGGILASTRPDLFYNEGVKVHHGLLPEAEQFPPDYDLFPEMDYSLSFASRGCHNSCLTGDTLINTLEGNIPIRDLVNKDKIVLFTFDPKTEKVFLTDGKCQKTGENKEIIRVTFDDRTYIDCTSNHRFLVFKNGNQFFPIKRWEVEAKDLKPMMRVHALRFYKTSKDYDVVSWARKKRKLISRMIAEYNLGRELNKDEVAHHIDRDHKNNSLSNISTLTYEEHWKIHAPDFSKRMKEDNPCRFLTAESWEKIRIAITGLKRTPEQKLKYSLSKMGDKNPNYKKVYSLEERQKMSERNLGENNPHYKNGKYFGSKKSKLLKLFLPFYINHKVSSVSSIGKADVYNLEVPSTNWFYANNVLVHNCSFCAVPTLEGKIRHRDNWVQDINPKFKKIVFFDNNWLALPMKTLEDDITKLKEIVKEHNITSIDFNQSLDCRLFTEDKVKLLQGLPLNPLRFSFDHMGQNKAFQKAVTLAKKYGFKNIRVDILYNWTDTPEDFYYRLKEVVLAVNGTGGCGVLMRYAPLDRIDRMNHVGPKWTKLEVDNVHRINPYPYGQVSSKSLEEFEYFFGKDVAEFRKLINYKDIKKLTTMKRNKFNKDKIIVKMNNNGGKPLRY